MADDLRVQAELRLKDNLSKPAGTALEKVGKSAAKTGMAVDGIGKHGGVKRTSKEAADAARSVDAVARSAQAAGRGLGTAADAGRRFRAALTSADRQALKLQRNMQGIGQAVRDAAGQVRTLSRGIRTGYSTIGGMAAAGYVAKSALQNPVNLEARSLSAVNTIYGDLPAAERIKKAKDLRAAAFGDARKYGGSVDAAMDMRTQLAAGGLDDATIAKITPAALKTVISSGAETKDVATLLVKGLRNKMFTAEQAQLAMDEAVMGGKKGSFEFSSMAKYLPDAAALGTGMKSHKGYQMHIANLQAVETVSANADAAGTNYKNLLQKLNAKEVRDNFKKKGGVDLTKVEMAAAAKGIDPITAMVDAIGGIMKKNKGYQKLKTKLEAAKNDDERKEITEQMLDIFQGSKLAQLIPDMQALTALIGIMSQKDYRNDVLQQLQQAEGTVDRDHAVIASGTEFKATQLAVEKDYAASRTHDAAKPIIDSGIEKVTSLARDNPTAATSAYTGATVGAAAAAAGATHSLLGGGPATAGAVKGVLAASELAARNAPWLMMGAAGLKVYNTATDGNLTSSQKKINNMETYGQFGGALGGMAMGAAAGSILPVLGNVAGAVIGGIMGYFAGGKAGRATGQLAWGDEPAGQTGQQKSQDAVVHAAQIMQQQPINATIELNVNLDGDKVAAAVERRQLRESARH